MPQFPDNYSAIKHFIHHVLTPVESHAWYEVFAQSEPFLDNSSESLDVCFQLRSECSIQTNAAKLGVDARNAFEKYIRSIESSYTQAAAIGWQFTAENRHVCLDTNGVYCVCETTSNRTLVTTAFIPGFGSAVAVKESATSPANPHARVTDKSWMRGDDSSPTARPRQSSIHERTSKRHAANWSTQQRIYHLVFRPVMQFIRGYQLGEKKYSVGIAQLKSVLPAMSQLKYDNWLALRQSQGVCS